MRLSSPGSGPCAAPARATVTSYSDNPEAALRLATRGQWSIADQVGCRRLEFDRLFVRQGDPDRHPARDRTEHLEGEIAGDDGAFLINDDLESVVDQRCHLLFGEFLEAHCRLLVWLLSGHAGLSV